VLGEQKTRKLMQDLLGRSPADQTEILIWAQDEQLTRFANNTIHQNVSETNVTITVRAAWGKRVGMATTNDLSADGLEQVVRSATDVARLQPENTDFPGFPEPQPTTTVEAFDEATAGCTPHERALQVGHVCRLAEEEGLVAAGAFSTGATELGVANSQGVVAYHPGTLADLVTVVMSEDSAGYAAGRDWKVERIDVAAMGKEAMDKALRSRNPRELEPGPYTVVLEPYATQDLLHMLGYTGMGALALQEGRSWMDGRIGQQIMAPAISIWDDGLDPNSIPLPFDFEGLPKQRVQIVREGVAQGVVYDTATARQVEGQSSTGHAVPPAMAATVGPLPLNLFLATGDATLEEMIASTEYGLLITRFHYTRPVHPRDAIITGLTRDGTFLIQEGAIAYPVKNMRYTQSYIEALAGTAAVGREAKTLGAFIGAQRVPPLKLSRFNFTGVTQF
jgi:PmbA protein